MFNFLKKRKEVKAREEKRKKEALEWEAYIKKHPEEYKRLVAAEKQKTLDKINKEYMEKGFISKPYSSYDEMMDKWLLDSARTLPKEEIDNYMKYGILPDHVSH